MKNVQFRPCADAFSHNQMRVQSKPLQPMQLSLARATIMCHQKGVALITALLITAMVAIAAVAISSRQQLDIRRTANTLHSDQAYLYALAAETFAKKLVKEFVALAVTDESREQIWMAAKVGFTESIPGGSIGGNIIDIDGSFPLNNIVKDDGTRDADYLAALQRLFVALKLDNPAVGNFIADWIDADDVVQGGAESLDYLGLERPYRAANTALVSLSELRLIAGFDPEGKDLNKIMAIPDPQEQDAAALAGIDAPPARTEPYVNVLPRGATINVNTAPAEVIMCLHDRITREIADEMVARQVGDPTTLFKKSDADDFKNFLADRIFGASSRDNRVVADKASFLRALDKFKLGVKSEYYEVTALAEIGSSHLTVKSLLKSANANSSGNSNRNTNNNAGRRADEVETLRRGIGVY